MRGGPLRFKLRALIMKDYYVTNESNKILFIEDMDERESRSIKQMMSE